LNKQDFVWTRAIGHMFSPTAVKEPVIFDVGANQGQYGSFLLEACSRCKVHSFELMPSTFQTLSEVRQNHSESARWTVHNFGAFDVEKEIDIKSRPNDEGAGIQSLPEA